MEVEIIKSENYETQMGQIVEPFLDSCSKERWLQREKGKKIHCLSYRAQNARGAILISHGFTESAEKFKEVIYYFLKAHFHVYIIDHCGHGLSYRLVDDLRKVHVDDYKRYVKDLIFLTQMVHKENPNLPVSLYAHSMGGAIAVLAAAKKPELFHKIVLTSPMIQMRTGPVPLPIARMIARVGVRFGKAKEIVPGQQLYHGLEAFEESCSTSRPRFDYYQKKRSEEAKLQTSAATFGWLVEGDRMSKLILGCAYKYIQSPVLLFQSDQEKMVSTSAQEKFVLRVNKAGHTTAELIRVHPSKHEIYFSEDEVMKAYINEITDFLYHENHL